MKNKQTTDNEVLLIVFLVGCIFGYCVDCIEVNLVMKDVSAIVYKGQVYKQMGK